jgi:hypothetical protein
MIELTQLTPEQREQRVKELYAEKTALLDQYGIFGGGNFVNLMHERINKQLEQLGIKP